MKITLSLLSIFLLAGIGLGQKSKSAAELKQQISTLKNKKNFSLDYIAVDDRTSVAFTSIPDTMNNSNFYAASASSRPERFGRSDFFGIVSGFEFEGKTLIKTADDFFIFITYTGYPYLSSGNPKLIALVEGQSSE